MLIESQYNMQIMFCRDCMHTSQKNKHYSFLIGIHYYAHTFLTEKVHFFQMFPTVFLLVTTKLILLKKIKKFKEHR